MTYANDNESLCCNARIDEQFARCTECGCHAEPVTLYTDGTPVEVDASGFITGPLVDESGRPLTTETFGERFRRDFNPQVNDAVGLIFLAVPILMLCLISFLAEGK